MAPPAFHDVDRRLIPVSMVPVAACLAYGATSVSITLFNKAVFSYFHFNFPNIVTSLQIVISIIYMYALKRARLMEFGDISMTTVRQVAPLTLCWWIYVVSGVTALRYLTVPMYSVFRRTTTLLAVFGEWLMFSKVPTTAAMVSIAIMLIGAVLAGSTDLSYSLPGYIYVSICAVSTTAYLLLIRSLNDKTGLSQHALLLHNNVVALPIMLAYTLLCTSETSDVLKYPRLRDPMFLAMLMFSASQAFLLNLAIFWCTTANSPVATTVTGQMKDIVTTGAGMIMFEHQFEIRNFCGVCIGLFGGMFYAFSRLTSSTVKQETSKE